MRLLNLGAAAALTSTCLASSGYLKLDVERRSPLDRRLVRRQNSDGSVDTVLTQNTNKLEYLVNITIGTPAQHLAVTLDTGSSDLWVPAASATLCKKGGCDNGAFDPALSSTYTVVDPDGFNITYAAPGDSDAGDWANDTITVGESAPIKEQQFGVASTLFDAHGVMGVGFDTNEAANQNPEGVYPSVMDNLQSAGIIHRKAYSLYLNDLQADKGAIIFGGVDTTKYTGDLVALPLQEGPEEIVSEFYVTLTSVTFSDHSGKMTQLSPEGYAQSVLLDSGTSQTLLTDDVFSELANGFGAVDIGESNYVVPCSFASSNGTVNYSFGGDGGVTIKVPISQLIGNQVFPGENFGDKSGGCDLGFGPPIGGSSILGDTFLRSAYAVFDIDNGVAALAQAAENKTDTSSIAVIPSGTAIPGASVTASAVGTQNPSDATTEEPAVPTASVQGTTLVFAGTPTFDIGVQSTAASAAATTTSSGGANAAAPTAALLGLGLAAGVMVL